METLFNKSFGKFATRLVIIIFVGIVISIVLQYIDSKTNTAENAHDGSSVSS